MAFSDFLGRDSIWLMPYLTISGIDRVFSNQPCPSSWETAPGSGQVSIAGETYTWDTSLLTGDREFAAISQRAQPLSGLGYSGRQSFVFQVTGARGGGRDPADDFWLHFLNDNVDRIDGQRTLLMESLSPTQTAATVQDTGGLFGVTTVHIGTECITVGGQSAPHDLTGLTRGRFGSTPLYHVAGDEARDRAVVGGGPFVTSWPLAFKGRLVRLWLAPGRKLDGRYAPYSAAIRGPHDAEVFAGVTQDREWSPDTLQVTIECADLLQLFERQVAVRCPKASTGHAPQGGTPYLWYGADNDRLIWKWERAYPGAGLAQRINNDRPLVDPNNFPNPLVASFHPLHHIALAIHQTFQIAPRPAGATWSVSVHQDGAKLRVVVVASGIDLSLYSLEIDATRQDSFWRELGFEDRLVAEPNVLTSTLQNWTFEAQRALPLLRLPVHDAGSDETRTRTLAIREERGAPWNSSAAFEKENGGTVTPAVRVGDVLVAEASTSSFSVELTRKNVYGSRQDSELYVEWSPDKPGKTTEIVRGLGFAGVGEFRMLLYCMLGGSGIVGHNHATYDQHWREPGCIPADLVDVASFERVNVETQPVRGKDNWFLAEPTSLRELAEQVCVANQAFIVPTWKASDGRFKIRCLRVEDPTATELVGAFELSADNVVSTLQHGVGYRSSQLDVVNVVEGQAEYDNAKKKFLQQFESSDINSVATFGRGDPVRIGIRGTGGADAAVAELVDVAGAIYRSFSTPYIVLTIAVATSRAWAIQLGDPVLVSSDVIPSRLRAGRGVTQMPGRIYGKVDVFRGPKQKAVRSVLTVVCANGGAARNALFAPSCRGTVQVGEIRDIENHAFSESNAALADVQWFEAGDAVRVYRRGREDHVLLTTIGAVTVDTSGTGNSAFELADDPSSIWDIDDVVTVEFGHYEDATARQRGFLYMADGGMLDGMPGFRWS